MSWWFWVLLGLALLAVEFASSTMHVGLFAVGAWTVALLEAAGVDMSLSAQLVTFTGVSVFALVVLRPMLVRKLNLIGEKKVIDSLVGEQALALEDIAVNGSGKAEMRGTTWTARNIGETALLRGQRCVVAAVDGLVIHIRAS